MDISRKSISIKLLGEVNNVNLYTFINDRGEDLADIFISSLTQEEEKK